ncbi:hypothetical protein M9H77_26124 [Catharanthus roseus]|uniref:Uncharacterized protein n=1 Tax=Catharanthus roseus TaxID=4058 RepID=A0ACC0ACV2_CATRO|nr:hypothetical protein M9H77_26124 [Catharanthus roseus]
MSNLYIARSGVITIFPIMSRHATSTTSWGRIRISIIHFPLKSLGLFPTPFLFHVWRIECQIKKDIPPKVLTQDRMKIRLNIEGCIPATKNPLDDKFSSIPCPLVRVHPKVPPMETMHRQMIVCTFFMTAAICEGDEGGSQIATEAISSTSCNMEV